MQKVLFFLFSLTLPLAALAESLTPFHASYEASYRGMKAEAERSLTALENDQYRLHTSVELKLLGATLTEIHESSLFSWHEDALLPASYEYVQSGLGSRSRRVVFDWDNSTAALNLNDNAITLPLEGIVLDELSAHIELKKQLESGATEAAVKLIDRDHIEEERYRVLDEETLETRIGPLRTVKLEKVRAPDSERVTELWLAPDYEYMLVKLYQRDPDGREFELLLSEATMGGVPLP